MAKRTKQSVNIEQRQRAVTEINVDDFMNTRYREYALSTAYDRAIPDVRDGFKPTARKIVYTAIRRLKDKKRTISSFAGYVKAESKYEHGPASLEGNIVTLAQAFKQPIPYLQSLGQIGTFYAPYAGATRYVECTLGKAFDLLMKDNDLISERDKEGAKIEPEFYLPIVPTILLNVIPGIAVGVSSTILNRNPIEVCDAVLDYLHGEQLPADLKLTPYAKGLIGEWRLVNGIYEHHGFMEIVDDRHVYITGLPYSFTFDSYEAHLNSLLDADFIEGYENNSTKGNIKYILEFKPEVLRKAVEDDSLYHKLKMYCRMEKENITVINFDGKIVRYDNIGDLIMNFVDWRIEYYELRKQKQLSDIATQIKWLQDVIDFIELVKSEQIVLHKQSTKEVEAILDQHNIQHEVLKIAVSKLTTDQQKKHAAEIHELKGKHKTIAESDNCAVYIADVEELRDKLESMGYQREKVQHYTIA